MKTGYCCNAEELQFIQKMLETAGACHMASGHFLLQESADCAIRAHIVIVHAALAHRLTAPAAFERTTTSAQPAAAAWTARSVRSTVAFCTVVERETPLTLDVLSAHDTYDSHASIVQASHALHQLALEDQLLECRQIDGC